MVIARTPVELPPRVDPLDQFRMPRVEGGCLKRVVHGEPAWVGRLDSGRPVLSPILGLSVAREGST